MKVTREQLKRIIKEELEASMVQEAAGQTPEDVVKHIKSMPFPFGDSAKQDFINMADGSTEMAQYYPHIKDLPAFAREVLRLLGE